MAKFDFTKPLNVSVTINEVHSDHVEEPTDSEKSTEKKQLNLEKNNIKTSNRSKTRNNSDNHRTSVRSTLFNQNPVHKSMSNIPQMLEDYTMQSQILEPSIINHLSSYVTTFGGLQASNRVNTYCAKDVNETTNLLNTVSRNLIRILQARFYYLYVINNSGTNYVLMNGAKMKYFDTKTYYLNLSRDIAVHELFPQRHNCNFVRTFIDRTRYMALTYDKFNCLEKDLLGIYNELMMWIMPKICNHPQPQNTKPISHSPVQTLYNAPQYNAQSCQNLQNDRYYHNTHQNEKIPNQSTHQNSKPGFFTYGSSGPEICINGNSHILNDVIKQNEINNSQRNDISNIIDIVTRQNETTNFLNTTSQIPHQDASRFNLHNPIRSRDQNLGLMSTSNDNTINLGNKGGTQNIQFQFHTTDISLFKPKLISSAIGKCRICGAVTTLKCTLCIDYYYCSSMCQELDWSRHKFVYGKNI